MIGCLVFDDEKFTTKVEDNSIEISDDEKFTTKVEGNSIEISDDEN